MNEQEARRRWSDYLMQGRVLLEIERKHIAAGIDQETNPMTLVAKNRVNAYNAYLRSINA